MKEELIGKIDALRKQAIAQAERAHVLNEFFGSSADADLELMRRASDFLKLVVMDSLLDDLQDDSEKIEEVKSCCADGFRLLRALPTPNDSLDAGVFMLQACALAVLGDKGGDAARWLRNRGLPGLPINDDNWQIRTKATVVEIWLRLIRKDGWLDRDAVLEQIDGLRRAQAKFEKEHLDSLDPINAKSAAIELIALYHMARAAEIFALYMTDGVVDGNYQIQQLLDSQFDRVLAVCEDARMIKWEALCRLLVACAKQMVENSIWTVTRAVNSRVTEFVKNLTDRGRGERAIFDVLPPQRRALAEHGLLGSSRRAVVVSLPTSSGKTLIAEFRILQALNQFEHERGWVAYLTPTRALVNQITRQLRRDFEPLNIIVEQVSPALEIDSVESDLLRQENPENEFRVIVATPEKLDLMLRQDWESEIGRPLTLVVVDEAHNIQSSDRGLRLELLLATINNECQRAHFLLLTPFIDNAKEIARWLGGQHNAKDISLSVDWQPNDRIVGIIQAEKDAEAKAGRNPYQLCLETVYTSRQTLAVDDSLKLPGNEEIALTYSKASTQSTLAAVTAQNLSRRGPVIVMHARPDWVWSLAEKLKIQINRSRRASRKVKLVQDFLHLEYGHSFPLIELLSYGIGIHHAGLSDDVRSLMEWLFEEDELSFLVATTTIAQGVNFPVSGIVMASHQYPYGVDMPPEDFWNIAGRAGRISQECLVVIALVANSREKAAKLRSFVNEQSGDLNSALIDLVRKTQNELSELSEIVYRNPQWSGFLQYLTHTCRQMGQPESFAEDIEQVLRNTLGFKNLRVSDLDLAEQFLHGVQTYAKYIQQPRQPVKLVDSTGFSLQSIRTAMKGMREEGLNSASWEPGSLFSEKSDKLQSMMGVLLRVPELRENLKFAIGRNASNGDKLASVVKDWVNGAPVYAIAQRHFMSDGEDELAAMTKCGQNLFGRVNQTVAWGLGALLSITGGGIPEKQMRSLRNLPLYAYYGVNSDGTIALRLLGVSRGAATRLANHLEGLQAQPLASARGRLRQMNAQMCQDALGEQEGRIYRDVWRTLEGLDP